MKDLVILDAGPLVSAADADSDEYLAVLRAMSNPQFQVVIPAMCIAEATYIIERDLGPLVEAVFLEGLRDFEVIAPEPEDFPRMAELVRQYADFPLGGTDASIVALAERLNVFTVITLDRRHFGAIRPRHCERLRLLPE